MSAGRRVDFLLYQAGPLAIAATTLAVWPLLGRVLPQVEVGTLSTILAIVSIAAPVLTCGLHLHLANRLAREPKRWEGVDGQIGVRWSFALLGVAALGALGMAIWSGQLLWQVASVSAATGATLIVLGVYRGLNRPWTYAALTVVAQFIALLGLAAGGAATGSLSDGLLVYVLVLMATASVGLVAARASRPPQQATNEAVLAASFRLVPHLVLAVATLLLTRIVVGAIEGPRALAAFQFAALLVGGITTVGASLDAHWSVRAQEAGSLSALTGVLARNLRLMLISSLLLVVAVVVFAEALLPLWLPPGYSVGAVRDAVSLALTAGVFQALADNRSAGMMWLGRGGMVSACTGIGVIVTLASSVLLVTFFDWRGAGLAIALGTAARAAASVLAVRQTQLRLDPRSMSWTAGAVLLAALPVLMIGK